VCIVVVFDDVCGSYGFVVWDVVLCCLVQ